MSGLLITVDNSASAQSIKTAVDSLITANIFGIEASLIILFSDSCPQSINKCCATLSEQADTNWQHLAENQVYWTILNNHVVSGALSLPANVSELSRERFAQSMHVCNQHLSF